MPASVAGGERSFSRFKVIKSYLRSSKSQEGLNPLNYTYNGNITTQILEFSELAESFAHMKARKVDFY